MQMLFENGKKKALTFSYDDGVAHDVRLARIFTKYGMKATFNLNSAVIIDSDEVREAPEGHLTWGELKKYITGAGHEAAVHTLTHPWIESLSLQDALYEIIEDRRNIEKNLKCIVRGMAYPFGCYSDTTLEAMRAAGIAYSRTTKATHGFELPDEPLTLHPTCHHNDAELFNIADEFLSDRRNWGQPRMLYVWGHSYEFPRDNNWERIEELCEKLAGKEDIWYATNIEIIDYMKAYNSLQVSYDKKMVYNPSAQPIWFGENGVHCVNPGETIVIE